MFLYHSKSDNGWWVDGDGLPQGPHCFETQAEAMAFMKKQTARPLKTIARQYQDVAGRMHTMLYAATEEHNDGFDAEGRYTGGQKDNDTM